MVAGAWRSASMAVRTVTRRLGAVRANTIAWLHRVGTTARRPD